MTATDLLAALRDAGITVAREDDRLRCEPARAIPDDLRAAIRDHKLALLSLLSPPSGIEWRADAMRAHIPERGPIPLLVAVPDLPPTPGRCFSCSAPLPHEPATRWGRCVACALAVVEALGGGDGAVNLAGRHGAKRVAAGIVRTRNVVPSQQGGEPKAVDDVVGGRE